MKRMNILMALLIILMLGACQNTPQEPATPPSDDGVETSTPASDAYPALPSPTATPQDADYPAPEAPATQAPPTAYPPDMSLWILRPLGEQCADPASYDYQTVEEAATALEEVGVEVSAAEEVSVPVCTACGCPTSEQYRVQIRAADLDVVQNLGWTQE